MPIPTIEQILVGHEAGTYTQAQAVEWIGMHISEAVAASFDLDDMAGRAMQVLMADAKFLRQARNAGHDRDDAVATAAYAQARAMSAARNT